jgi:DNA-binding CsgD family transcriptional regulator
LAALCKNRLVPAGVVGRDVELEAAGEFLERLELGPAGLALEGEPGIGKTTLWRAISARAADRGHRVLTAGPGEQEKRLSFSGLADLLAGIESTPFDRLPPPQRRALDAILLRTDDVPSSDPRVVFTAALAVLTALAEDEPVVIAIDDTQWLDPPSARSLQFVARRLKEQRVGLLISSRLSEPGALHDLLSSLPVERTNRLKLGPLTLAATHQLLKERFGHAYRRLTLLRIQQASGGNPFFALEIADALGDSDLRPGEPLPVSGDVRGLVRRRIDRLPEATRRALLRAAVLSQPTSTLAGESLEPARRVGLVDELPDGRIAFTHPLYASAVHEAATPEERRRTHHELAELVSDIEERARHLALGASGPDERVATELDRAAKHAGSRGAPELAAELQDLAFTLTPLGNGQAAHQRALAAAVSYIDAGALGRAGSMATRILSQAGERATRVIALRVLAEIRHRERSVPEAIELLKAAAVEAGEEPSLRGPVEMELIHQLFHISPDLEAVAPHLGALLTYSEGLTDPSIVAEAFATATWVNFLLGRGVDEKRLARALEIEDREHSIPMDFRPAFVAGSLAFYTGQFDRARALLYPLRSWIRDRGWEGDLPPLLFAMAWLECWAGDLEQANRLAEEAIETTRLTESESLTALSLGIAALVDAHAGRIERCRERLHAARPRIEESEYGLAPMWAPFALGFLEISLGNPAPAVIALEPLTEFIEARGVVEPIRAFFLPDAIEALVALGELDRAESLTAMFSTAGRKLDRPWALARGGRCRALIHAARGDADAALSEIESALSEHRRVPMPLERGRTLLAKGEIERRAKQKAAARASLKEALAVFEQVGAPLWAERARSELARVGPGHAAPGDLTPTEQRVAALAASGLTNREVATQLFMSPKTVEANLARVYRKLGIHTRAELGAKLGG